MTIAAPSTETIERAAVVIRDGQLVGMPTETVYGLAGDAMNGRAVAAIYEAKGRPRFNPLIVHVGDLAQAAELVEMTPLAVRLADAYWPGPLTLVARAREGHGIADLVMAGLDTLAVRVPAHPVALALLQACGRPLAAPSANVSGRISPTTAAHVANEFGAGVAMILDGGPCGYGLESTILSVSGNELLLLRPGAIAVADIEALLDTRVMRAATDPSAPSAPGQLLSHYAPRAAVRLNAVDVKPGEGLLAFGREVPVTTGPIVNLSVSGDLVEAAQGLFAALRTLDASNVMTIAVMPVPSYGLGEAINDRLMRAAAARD